MTTPRTVRVNVEPKAYEILVGPDLLNQAGRRARALLKGSTAVVIYDRNVESAHLPALDASLAEAGWTRVIRCGVEATEENKSTTTVDRLYGDILKHGIDRGTPIFALGGGVIGDMAGFVAATILRGVPFVQVPTTLLSMVDASVGGKTGVNHAVGKNLIGAFKQPDLVLIDPLVLRTLPSRELCGGLAECIKHDIIRDADGFAALEQNIGRALALDVEYLTDLIAHNVAIKARVVEADPFERGERAHLNYGHTFGHAIETISRYAYSHGESVALGMVAAAKTAVDLGMLDDGSRRRIVNLISAAGLPTGGLPYDPKAIVKTMGYDKKVQNGTIRLVLPDRLGHVVVRDDVPVDVMQRAVEHLTK